MPQPAANLAHFLFESSGLAPDTFQLASFRGVEEISQLFRFDLQLVSSEPDVDFAAVVNESATLSLMRSDTPVPICGVVSHFEQAGRTKDHHSYRAVLVPRLWRLTLFHQSRIFQEMSTVEIVQEVLTQAGLSAGTDFRFDVSGSYQPREYCVQYRETDFNFVSRLLEYEGIFYFFEHEGGRDILVMTDDRTRHPEVADENVLVYRDAPGLVPGRESVTGVRLREQVVTGKVVLKDYNYRTPDAALQAESQVNSAMPGLYYEYGDHFKDAGQGKSLAKVRNEEVECRRRVVTADSDCMGLRAGYVFAVDEHYRADLNEKYVVTRIEHQGSQRKAMSLAGLAPGGDKEPEFTYANRFTCIPASVQYRPARLTPIPQLPGILTARVETGGGDYAYIDDDGNYRAKMHFDLGDRSNGTATRPIRMSQPYSGPDYGIHFPNHQNTELVWACIDGNLDRPLALGTVPNPNNVSPSTGANRMQNVIRTWGKNELTFDDAQGEENIYLFATKDHTVEVTNDETIGIGHDQRITVKNDRNKNVDANQSERVGANKQIEVVGNHSESIGGSMSQDVGSTKTETIAVSKTLSVGGAYQVGVGGTMSEDVGGQKSESVGGNKSESVGGSKSVSIGKNLSITVADSQNFDVAKNLNEKIGGDHHEQTTKEWAVNAKKIQLMADDQIVLKTGSAEIVMKKNGDIVIKGKKIQVKGSGDVIIKGSKIKEN